MKYKTILFDMDGTVLYTLPDLCDSVNYSLTQFGYAPITIEQTRRYVGNASRRLIEQAAPDADSETRRPYPRVLQALVRGALQHQDPPVRRHTGAAAPPARRGAQDRHRLQQARRIGQGAGGKVFPRRA